MNLLYNMIDVTALISSNEGWGLSLTESMMAGKPIIANVTGGMQDQMRFEDKEGNWLDFDKDFCSNHFGTFKNHGRWAYPVFPSNMSLVGSVPTPYIFDDRCDFRDVAEQMRAIYDAGKEYRDYIGKEARKWVTSDEAMMTARWMSKNVIDTINETLNTWTPRKSFELIKTEPLKPKYIRHKLVY